MTTSPQRLRSHEGFTLIEVLVAMLILAVGLLGLEALGIGAARAVTLAEKQTEYSSVATRHLEVALDSIRLAPASVAGATWTEAPHVPAAGDVVERAVASPSPGLYTVTITVTPNSGSSLVRPAQFTLEGSAYVAP